MLLAGTKSGDVWMWLIPTTNCKTFAGHGARCTVGEVLHDGELRYCLLINTVANSNCLTST